MTKALCFVLTFLLSFSLTGQIKYEEINSARLNSKRQLKIKLPKNYDPSSELKHPLIIVFDGDYLFEPVAGQVDFQTYFDDMPGSIIVGVVQGKQRFYDGYNDQATGMPTESGLRFHEFVAEELIPYLDDRYKTSKFKVAVGHDRMGNFINSFLFKDKQAFQAYVCISPDLQGSLKAQLASRLEFLDEEIFYYMATSDKDIRHIKQSVNEVHQEISAVENQNLTYYYDEFKNDTHYTLVTSAIARAFDKIFDLYKPLREKELEEKVLPYEGTLDEYLTKRYDRIEELFGIKKPITEEEFEKVVKVAEEREDLESLYKIGKLAKKLNPNSALGTYYLALHSEKIGKNKKATKLYESALTLEETNSISREFIMSQVEKLNVVTDDNTEEEDDDEEN
ncbi:MAG: alpha/beta hydrolase-fold protein [Bacteroidota bacterium]